MVQSPEDFAVPADATLAFDVDLSLTFAKNTEFFNRLGRSKLLLFGVTASVDGAEAVIVNISS
ncbi:MAG: hypothetical protein N3E52_02110 [Candidatus Bathyarchaeota archaeon]|nr:hypothetical protein [Candidatus Bathyarchaeota archaeon]